MPFLMPADIDILILVHHHLYVFTCIFEVHTGEHVTLVGRTGAGKSTIFRLLLGLYQPSDGSVRISGTEASLISDKEKRRIFGYVEQTFHMVPGTVRDQITLFDGDITNVSEDRTVLSISHRIWQHTGGRVITIGE